MSTKIDRKQNDDTNPRKTTTIKKTANIKRNRQKHPHEGHSFWSNLKRNYKVRKQHLSSRGANSNNKIKRDDKKQFITRLSSGHHHLTIDKLAAKRKLEQLRLLTQTDLAILNSAEPYRVSSYTIFKRNLLDPALYLSVSVSYLLSKLLTRQSNHLSFLVLFTFIFAIINHHIESYRSFVLVNESFDKLSKNYELRRRFLSTHLGYDPRTRREAQFYSRHLHQQEGSAVAEASCSRQLEQMMVEPETIEEQLEDSFRWVNRIIRFFWPYLSHLIHYELNEFFRDKIDSGQLAHSVQGTKRLLYAIISQLDTNILVIEKCQLGHHSPMIKKLGAFEGTAKDLEQEEKGKSKGTKKEKERKEKKKRKEKEKKTAKRMAAMSGLKTVMSDLMSPPSENSINYGDEKETTPSIVVASAPTNKGKTLVYNINLVYNGDMDISVIYRYFCCCSSRVGLKDVFLHFNLCITLGPISEQIPFIDQVSFTLLELPIFGYKGIALAELAELRLVRKLINRLIKDHLLYPRQVTVSLRELLVALLKGPRQRQSPSNQQANGDGGGGGGSLPSSSKKTSSTTATNKEEVSRIEPHPGKIESSSDRPVLTLTTKSQPKQQQQQQNGVSFWTRLQANALICGCVSANFLLRCCQCCGRRRSAADDNLAAASASPSPSSQANVELDGTSNRIIKQVP